MKKIRYRVAVLVVMTSVLLALTGCSGRRSEQHRLEGDAYLQIRKLGEATEAYQKAVAANPQNALAKVGLGRCLLAQQHDDEALAQFREAIETDKTLETAYAEAITILLRNERTDEALALSEQCEAVNPEHGGMLHAFVLLRIGRTDDAVALLTKLRDRFPGSLDTRINLASALLGSQHPDKAEEELQAALRMDPKSVAARMALIDTYKMQGKTAEIVQEFEKLTAEHPDDVNLRLGLARSLVYAGRVDEAQAIAQNVLEQDKNSPWANYVMGCGLMEKKQYSEAVPYLQTAEAALPAQTDVSRRLALARAGGETKPQPAPSPAPVSASPAPAPPREKAPAEDWQTLWRQASLARLVAGRETYIAKGDPNVKETLLVAALLMRNGALADEIAAQLPEDSPFRKYIDVVKKNTMNDILKFHDEWKEDDSQRQFLRDSALGFALVRGGARARGVQVFSKCLETWPDNIVSLYNIAQAFREAGMPEFAAKTLQKVIAKTPDNVDAHTSLFVMLREAGLRQEARNAAEAAYNLFPTSRDAVVGMCLAYLDTRDLDMAKKVMERAMQALPDDATLKVEYAVLLLQSGAAQEAQKFLEQTTAPPNLAGRTLMLLALSAALQDDWPAVTRMREGVDEASLGPVMRLLFAAASVKSDHPEDAIKILASSDSARPLAGRMGLVVLQALGQSPAGLDPQEVELAKSMSADPETLSTFAFASACQAALVHDAALDVFRKIEPKLGDNPRFLQLVFASLGRSLRTAKPEEEARSLAERHANMAAAWVGLAVVARLLDDSKAEREALDKAATVDPNAPDVWFQRGQFEERRKDMKAAGEAYKRLVELRPEDPMAKNNAAYCLLVTGGDLKEALSLAEKAKEKLPSNAQVLHTLGVAQLRSGDLDQSRRNLALALEFRPGDPTLLLDFGQLLIAQKQVEEGKHDIELAILYADQLGLDFPRREEAQKALAERK